MKSFNVVSKIPPPPTTIDPLVTYKYMSLQACLKDQRRLVIYDASENVTICLKISVWVEVVVGGLKYKPLSNVSSFPRF